MLHGTASALAKSRVHPAAPALIAVAGLAWVGVGHAAIGAGIVIGALVAYVNGILLSHRVDLAATTGNVGAAMIVMQVGLLITLTLVGVATVVLIHFSLPMAIAAAAGFAAAHMAILIAYYITRARNQPLTETQTT